MVKLNNFALSVRQECREPMSIVFQRKFSEIAGETHLLQLLDAIEKGATSLFENDTVLRDYAFRIKNKIYFYQK